MGPVELPVAHLGAVARWRASRRASVWRRRRLGDLVIAYGGPRGTVPYEMLVHTAGKDVAAAMATLTVDLGPTGAKLVLLAMQWRYIGIPPGDVHVAAATRAAAGTFPASAFRLPPVRAELEPHLAGLPPLALEVMDGLAPGFRGSLQQLVDVAAAVSR